jgi:hypothetical protein
MPTPCVALRDESRPATSWKARYGGLSSFLPAVFIRRAGLKRVPRTIWKRDAPSVRTRGAELGGEVERYEDSYRPCYVRGPVRHHRRISRVTDARHEDSP